MTNVHYDLFTVNILHLGAGAALGSLKEVSPLYVEQKGYMRIKVRRH